MAVSEEFRKIQPRLKDFHNGIRQLRPRASGLDLARGQETEDPKKTVNQKSQVRTRK
jgi:hypothetical protein